MNNFSFSQSLYCLKIAKKKKKTAEASYYCGVAVGLSYSINSDFADDDGISSRIRMLAISISTPRKKTRSLP